MRKYAFAPVVALLFVAGCPGGNGNDEDVKDQDVHYDATPNDAAHDVAVLDEGGNKDVAANGCLACLAPGQTFLFRTLDVTEPATPMELPALLNTIWAPDILEYRLNIMMKVEEVVPQQDGTLKMRASAGSAWHDLSFEDVRTLGNTNVPQTFHFTVPELVKDIWFSIDANCDFITLNDPESGDMPGINFRPGTVEKYLLCSAGNDAIDLPPHTVPIRGLYATGHFNADCTKIEDANLSGCIAKDAACELCNMVTAPDYDLWESTTPDPSVEAVPCDASYCKHHCGKNPWTNFGGFVLGVGVPLNCDLDGDTVNEGFRLTAGFWAQGVTYAEPQ